MGVRRGAAWSRRLLAGVCVALLGFQTSCYTLQPFRTDVPPGGDRVGIILNDRGRVLMDQVLGPSVDMVEGSIAGVDSAAFRVSVARVVTIRGDATTWTGETVVVPREGVAGFRERKLSKTRSWVLAGILLGAIVYSIVGLGINGLGGDPDDPPCTPPLCEPNPSIRW